MVEDMQTLAVATSVDTDAISIGNPIDESGHPEASIERYRCRVCGFPALRPTGSCFVCTNCGSSDGCN